MVDLKKISILSLHLGYGGIERSVISLANMLANNYEVTMPSTIVNAGSYTINIVGIGMIYVTAMKLSPLATMI